MSKGVLYGVGTGPGDPELLTIKAVRTIESCPVIAAPQTADGAMVALDIVRGAVDLTGKTVTPRAILDDARRRAPRGRACLALFASLSRTWMRSATSRC